jgi:formylglycine-generating enzyme required for sulfatase activity
MGYNLRPVIFWQYFLAWYKGNFMINRMPIILIMIASFLIQTAVAAMALNNNDFVYIPHGSFIMGDNDRGLSENKPEHSVTLTKGFLMYNHEITQKEWFDGMGTRPWVLNPPHENIIIGDNYPAVYIKWTDAQAFISMLNTGLPSAPYSLPTEAQWEYACRAGTDTHFSFGNYDSANPNMAAMLNAWLWYRENAWLAGGQYPHAVKQKRKNPFGLYDMHGNVYEWCYDGPRNYTTTSQTDPVGSNIYDDRIARGGAIDVPAFLLSAYDCSSASRKFFDKDSAAFNRGFRVVVALTNQLDTDSDGITDIHDNCPVKANADQLDFDSNGIGDACETQAQYFGDLNGNDGVDLADAVLAGQVLAGMAPSVQFDPTKDPNQNDKIGLEDLIFILQTLGGLR